VKEVREKSDKIKATRLEHYAWQLNKNLEDRMEELMRRIDEINTSSKKRLHT
jgi:hypothetical protein